MSGYFWLASYPKSGNTWLRLALWSLERDGAPVDFSAFLNFAPIAANRETFDAVLGIESSDLSPAEIASLRPRVYEAQAAMVTAPLFAKVHDAWTLTPAGEPLFPPSATLGAIYLVRDPRDVAVSYAHHAGLSVDHQIACMEDPDLVIAVQRHRARDQLPQRLLDWSSHVESWLEAPGRPPLLMRYEDMLADPVSALDRVTGYMGRPASRDVLERCAAATRFSALRAAEERDGFRERLAESSNFFFRRGVSGGWRDTLTAEQAARIERAHGRVMARLGYL